LQPLKNTYFKKKTTLLFIQPQALDEHEMIKDGDKILIGISGTSSSLALLHAIRQFSRARGLQITIGATTVGSSSGVDPRALMLYMRDLGVTYYYEHDGKIRQVVVDHWITHYFFIFIFSVRRQPERQTPYSSSSKWLQCDRFGKYIG
jgi:hypothetical protein